MILQFFLKTHVLHWDDFDGEGQPQTAAYDKFSQESQNSFIQYKMVPLCAIQPGIVQRN